MRNPSFEGKSVRVKYDPESLGTAWAFLGDQWVQCRPNRTLNLDNRTEKELKIATLEWRRSSQLIGQRRLSSHKNLAELLKTAQQNKAIQLQQAKDRALRNTRLSPAVATPTPITQQKADKSEKIEPEVSPPPSLPEAPSQASPMSDYGDF